MTAPIRARLGQLIEAQLTEASPNTSAALRAYVLLGFAAAGVDMAPFRRELARALAEDLSPELLAALARLSGRPTSVGQVSYILPPDLLLDDTPAADESGDPFLSGLIEV